MYSRISQHAGLMLMLFLNQPAWAELRDPTMPPNYTSATAVTQQVASAGYKLSAIFSGPAGRSAVINGQLVRMGEDVSGGTLLHIDSGHVEIQRGGEKQIIQLISVRVKEPSGH